MREFASRRVRRVLLVAATAGSLVGCQTTGLNPTGLHGTEVRCSEGPRQTLDCRGAIQQYARDFRADVAYMQTVAVGIGSLSNKLIEADAITSDLVQHYYQSCTLYNACLITRQEYVAKTERLQEIQLSVRQALAAAGFGAYYVVVESVSSDRTKVSALGIRYRYERRAWARWDTGAFSEGAGGLLVNMVEKAVK